MPEVRLVIRNSVGLHARPAALFVETANAFASDIKVVHNEREVNAKSIISILTLGVKQGAEILVRACGADSEQALQALADLVNRDFQEAV